MIILKEEMKRKCGSGKCKPKKPSVTGTVDVFVDPGYFSDINEEIDGFDSRTQIETREVNIKMGGQPLGLDKPVINDETVGRAAAKLARALSSSHTNPTSDRVPLQRERIGEKEPKSSHRDPVYNKQELDTIQLVIKRIMKMDAAVPFNAPVDPIALGIPDYFDIIDTPMDFGTICRKLENGLEYKNSEEVFKDVQCIWDNCCKYNKKGSHIVELMKRVKSNFMKQWTAAGLYKEQQTVTNGQLRHNPQLFAESTGRHQEDVHIYPVGSNISRSAYLQQHDWTLLNLRQHQQLSPCCSHTFKPQQISYDCQCSWHSEQSQPGQHQHDLAPQHNHCAHLHSRDLMNGNSCSQWVNEASPSLVHSCQPSPSCSVIGHPKQRACKHQPISSQLPPSRLQADINTQHAGHSHLPTLTFNKCEQAFNSGRDTDNGYQQQQYQVDSVHMQTYLPSAGCMSMHQINQSTCQQLQSSHVEGSRNIDCAGNLHIPPPTESTENCTKRDTSCQELNQIKSTPDQSSSTINIEACQPLESSCQNQPESSPSECLHSIVDDIFPKRKTRSQGLMQCQEQSSSMMNSQKHQPQENTCQIQRVSPQSRPSPPTADYNRNPKRKSRGRGATLGIVFREGERIPIITNGQGQPVGPQAQKLVTFLGTLARNGHFLPLTYLDWRAVPFEKKENMWEKVRLGFDIDPMSRDWVLQSLGLRWKDWKSKLKTARYYPHETDEERLADRDERVLPDQWAALVTLWNTESVQKRSARNRANRMQQKYIHTTGRKSFARIREEQRANRPDGKEPSRAELFILTRTRRNGKPVNEASSEVITRIRHQANGQDTPQDSNKQGDVLSQIIGPDKKGRARCIELGASPSDLGGQKPTHAEAIKMVSDANAEIGDMKEKMAAMEQTCAQMASQMAAMMSMMSSMQRNRTDNNAPDMVAVTSDASDHSVPHQILTRPTPHGGSTHRAVPGSANS